MLQLITYVTCSIPQTVFFTIELSIPLCTVLVDPSEVNRVFSGRIPQAALCVCSAGGLAQLPLSFLPQNYLPVCK